MGTKQRQIPLDNLQKITVASKLVKLTEICLSHLYSINCHLYVPLGPGDRKASQYVGEYKNVP